MLALVRSLWRFFTDYYRFVRFCIALLGAFLLTAFAAARNLVWLLLLVLVVLLLMTSVRQSHIGRRATIITFVALVASHWAPLDICLRCGSSLRISVMPIVYQDHTYATWRQLKGLGFVENSDFVVYRRWSLFPPAEGAVVIIMPAICHGEEFSPGNDEE